MIEEKKEIKASLEELTLQVSSIEKLSTELTLLYTAANDEANEPKQSTNSQKSAASTPEVGKLLPSVSLSAFIAAADRDTKRIETCIVSSLQGTLANSSKETQKVLRHFIAELQSLLRAVDDRVDRLMASPSDLAINRADTEHLLKSKKHIRKLLRSTVLTLPNKASEAPGKLGNDVNTIEEMRNQKYEKQLLVKQAVVAHSQRIKFRSLARFEEQISLLLESSESSPSQIVVTKLKEALPKLLEFWTVGGDEERPSVTEEAEVLVQIKGALTKIGGATPTSPDSGGFSELVGLVGQVQERYPLQATAADPSTNSVHPPLDFLSWLAAARICDEHFAHLPESDAKKWLWLRDLFVLYGVLVIWGKDFPSETCGATFLATATKATDPIALFIAAFILLDGEAARANHTFLSFASHISWLFLTGENEPYDPLSRHDDDDADSTNATILLANQLLQRCCQSASNTKVLLTEDEILRQLNAHPELEKTKSITNGRTLLHMATRTRSSPTLIRVLLHRGFINPRQLDYCGRRASEYAHGAETLSLFLPHQVEQQEFVVLKAKSDESKRSTAKLRR